MYDRCWKDFNVHQSDYVRVFVLGSKQKGALKQMWKLFQIVSQFMLQFKNLSIKFKDQCLAHTVQKDDHVAMAVPMAHHLHFTNRWYRCIASIGRCAAPNGWSIPQTSFRDQFYAGHMLCVRDMPPRCAPRFIPSVSKDVPSLGLPRRRPTFNDGGYCFGGIPCTFRRYAWYS